MARPPGLATSPDAPSSGLAGSPPSPGIPGGQPGPSDGPLRVWPATPSHLPDSGIVGMHPTRGTAECPTTPCPRSARTAARRCPHARAPGRPRGGRGSPCQPCAVASRWLPSRRRHVASRSACVDRLSRIVTAVAMYSCGLTPVARHAASRSDHNAAGNSTSATSRVSGWSALATSTCWTSRAASVKAQDSGGRRSKP
jgi:hypothetical protein